MTKDLLHVLFAAALATGAVPFAAFGAPSSADIVGRVLSTEREPISGAKISIKDPSGKVLAQTSCSGDGRYAMRNLPTGKYHVTLETGQRGLRGETVVAALGPEGLTVNWVVSQHASAVATATPGIIGGLSWGEIGTVVLINAAGASFGSGVAAVTGGLGRKNDLSGQVASPSQ